MMAKVSPQVMMKRSIERREFLSQLLLTNHSASISSHYFGSGGNNNVSNVACLPACELKSLLMTISAECSGYDCVTSVGCRFNYLQKEDVVYEQPRKRERRSFSNNLHSILRFVERILESRYAKEGDDAVAVEKNAQFLQNEMQRYLGISDALFRAEEDVLCLIFELAYRAISSFACFDNSDDISLSHLKPIFDSIHQRDIVNTSLRIIDNVIYIDKRERNKRKRERPRQSRMFRASLSNVQCAITHKRQKYKYLLQQTSPKNQSEHNLTPSSERESLMQKRYPREWKWLVEFKSKYVSISETNLDNDATVQLIVHRTSDDDDDDDDDDDMPQKQKPTISESQTSLLSEFTVLRRKYEYMDDISLASSESDQGIEEDNNLEVITDTDTNTASNIRHETINLVDNEAASSALSPIEELDKESRELRTTLLDLPSGELSSAQVVNQATETLVKLLNRYSDLSGTTGINHCGDIIAGNSCDSSSNKFPLNEEIVTLLIKSYLTSATGALRAKAILKSFVLPLVLEMNPVATTTDKKPQKPASRSLTSLLATLARDRPMECVDSILAPALVLQSTHALDDWEPSRFQCELTSRVLRVGKDSLSLPAIAQFVEKLLPTDEESMGVKWTDNTLPLLTTCLNRRPPLSELVIGRMADEIIETLSPSKCNSMERNMKFATLFNALVTKYGPQLKTTSRVNPLLEAVSRLNTFMSKTITESLKKL